MIRAVVGILHAHDLLPYYLEHYRRVGVDEFSISCSANELDSSGALERWLSTQSDVKMHALPRGFVRSNLVGMIEEEIRSQVVGVGDWVIPADLDELNQYPGSLRELVAQMQETGCSHVSGALRDRIAPGGVLAALEPFERGISIWDQYPIDADITAHIAAGSTEKVLISRGDLGWRVGHHQMRPDPLLKAFPARGVAHHFKWRAGLPKNLAWRIESEERKRIPWSEESLRIDRHLRENGRIVLDDMRTKVGWRPS